MSRTGRQRLDERMLADGLTETRSRAQSLIRAGRVLVDDTPVDKPGTAIRADASVRTLGSSSVRQGEKLRRYPRFAAVDSGFAHIGATPGGYAFIRTGRAP